MDSAKQSQESGVARFLVSRFRPYLRRLIAAEASTLARYCDQVILLAPSDESTLLSQLCATRKSLAASIRERVAKIVTSLLGESFETAHDLRMLLRDVAQFAGVICQIEQ